MPITGPLPPDLEPAWRRLRRVLTELGSVLVAFSGGADSSLLLAAAHRALGDRAAAAICLGPFTPPWEVDRARALARSLGVRLLEVDADELSLPDLAANPPERCYLCKRHRLALLQGLAREHGLAAVAEGSQVDDLGADRPGARAVAELGVASPLARAGLDKDTVRALGRAWGLAAADAPSGACLATRIPHGRPLSAESLDRVARAEEGLRRLLPGRQVRVRDWYPLAVVEVEPDQMAGLASPGVSGQVVKTVAAAGYQRVALDLAGYGGQGAGSA